VCVSKRASFGGLVCLDSGRPALIGSWVCDAALLEVSLSALSAQPDPGGLRGSVPVTLDSAGLCFCTLRLGVRGRSSANST